MINTLRTHEDWVREEGRIVSYTPVNVIVLGCFVEGAIGIPAVDHAPTHGNGGSEDMLDELVVAGMAHGIDAPFRESEVDGLGEVQRRRGRITQVCRWLVSSRVLARKWNGCRRWLYSQHSDSMHSCIDHRGRPGGGKGGLAPFGKPTAS